MRSFVLAMFSASMLLHASVAAANADAGACAVLRVVPPAGGSVPANAAALLAYVTPDSTDGGASAGLTATVTGPTTTIDLNVSIAPGPRALRLPAEAGLEEGPSTLSYALDCADAGATSSPFVVGPAAPLPKTIGTVSTIVAGAGQPVVLTVDPAVAAWKGLIRATVFVDSTAVGGSSSYDLLDGSPLVVSTTSAGTLAIGSESVSLDGVCRFGPHKETHDIGLSVEIAGGVATYPVTVSFDFVCPAPPPPANDAGLRTPPDNTPVATGDGDDDIDFGSSGGGCVASGTATGSWATLLGAAAALFVLTRRRR